jgi:unsaturated rhamnogalacturonyl hydrolase
MPSLPKTGACLILICASVSTIAQQKYFQDWPENADPHTVGDRVAIHFLESAHLNPIVYPEVCAWYGALKYAEATNNPALQAQLQARYRPLLTPQFHDLIPDKEHVDYEIFGAVPL